MTLPDHDTSPDQREQSPTTHDGGYGWQVDNSRKLDARLGDVMRRNLERIARERGVSVEALLDESPADRAAEDAAAHREWREGKTRALLSRIPEQFRTAEPRLTESRAWLDEYAHGRRDQSLALLGPVGTGKTHEAYAIMRRLLLDLTVPVQAVTAVELRAMLRPNEDGAADVGLLQAAPVLFLDDLGAEGVTEWQVEQFEAVVDYRYARRMPWIITSNLAADEIRPRYGNRIADRLGTAMTPVDMPALPSDLRGRGPAF